MGCRPPSTTVDRGGHKVLARPDPEYGTFIERDQIVVISGQDEYRVPVFQGMSTGSLQEKIKDLPISDPETIKYFGSESLFDEIRSEIFEIYPSAATEGLKIEKQVHEVIHADFIVSDHYFRAIAKIAFHFYLMYGSGGETGSEDHFAPLRHFVKRGGNPDNFIVSRDRLGIYFGMPVGTNAAGKTLVPAQWRHILMCARSMDQIAVAVRLFVGGGNQGALRLVKLADFRNESSCSAAAYEARWPTQDGGKGEFAALPLAHGLTPSSVTGPLVDRSSMAWPFFVTYPRYPLPGIWIDDCGFLF